MPEIKNNFTQGKMNKDLDERIIPKGQYRNALNIEISTSEGSDVGTVQNLLGNVRIENVIGGNWNCVGAISDEKNNRFFWFLTNPSRDAIYEYDTSANAATPVVVDVNLDVLKFQGNIITGINIIDDILLWTDNNNEPRKINIERCKLGADANNPNSTHTKLVVNDIATGEDLKEEHIVVIKKRPLQAPFVKINESANPVASTGIGAFSQNNQGNFQAIKGDIISVYVPRILAGLIYVPGFTATIGDKVSIKSSNIGGALPTNAQVVGEITSLSTQIGTPGYTEFQIEIIETLGGLPLHIVDDSAIGAVTGGVEVDILKSEDISGSIFEEKFIRFGTRWKYEDGEYSAFSPFTQAAFKASVFSFHPTKDGFNKGMENNCAEIQFTKLVPPNTPRDVVQVDILFKVDNSTTVYSIDSLKRNDPAISGNPNLFNSIESVIPIIENNGTLNASFDPSGGYTGTYTISSENIYAALPSNQLLRPWDNVPKKALAQEVTGNRVVYANYTQGYNMIDADGDVVKPRISVDYRQRSYDDDDVINFSTGKKSLKTFKNYQIGVVYGDEYGRESPVFTSQNASLKIPWDSDTSGTFLGNASRSTQLMARIEGDQPTWAKYYKFFVKETSGQYYNLAMDKVYRDENGENLWISFPSSDVNKVQKEDYIILKKKINLNEQVPNQNKYKVIDIKNEAPDFIKFDLETVGNVGGVLSTVQDLYIGYTSGINIPEVNQNLIEIKKSVWVNNGGVDLTSIKEGLELVFTKLEGSTILQSETYKITSVTETNSGSNYKISFNKSITNNDNWVLSDPVTLVIEPSLKLKISRRIPKKGNEFSGRFFVKIILDLTAKQFLESAIIQNTTYRNSLSIDSYYLFDSQAISGASADTGVVNTTNARLGPASNGTFSVHAENKSNTRTAWEKIYEFGTGSTTPSFFIDQSYFASVHPIDTSDPSGQTGALDAGVSGRFVRGNGGSTGQYFVDSVEGIVDTTNNNPYRKTSASATIDDPNGWGGRNWTTHSRGEENDVAFVSGGGVNQIDNIYDTDGGIYMHLSFGPVGDPLWIKGSQKLFTHTINAGASFWQSINPGRLVTDYPIGLVDSSELESANRYLQNYPGGAQYGSGTSPGSNIGYNPNYEAADGTPNPFYADQWKIKDAANASIASKIVVGAQFKIEGCDEVFTVLRTRVKRLYNHTPFRTTQQAWDGNAKVDRQPYSVEHYYQLYIDDQVNANGGNEYNAPYLSDFLTNSLTNDLADVLVDFGDPSNRRLLYIMELDKDPREYITTADFLMNTITNQMIRFVEPTVTTENIEVTSPAIWETEIKEETDLNIYYEASDGIPLRLDKTKTTSEMYAPIGSRVWCSKAGSLPSLIDQSGNPLNYKVRIKNWHKHTNDFYQVVELAPGLNVIGTDNSLTAQTSEYQSRTLRFFNYDGNFVASRINEVIEVVGDLITKIRIGSFNYAKNVGLSYYDNICFGNGVESSIIRDDFNAIGMAKGVKASSVLQEDYQEETRKNGLIYSGIYNSTSGVNNLNQFIQAEKITKDLNPTYGSIQKLFQRRIDLIALCEDKIVKILSNKDALFNADGNAQLVATNKVLGDSNPFVGDYGISTDPASFAKESYRAYFTDKQRGSVIRLSMDGLTPISEAGMTKHFKDTLSNSNNIVGSYDVYKQEYNLTIDNTTVSYSEKVRGWTSFKSYVPEFGISSSNSYYTFNNGQPYKHHSPDVNRNLFYGNQFNSSVDVIVNDQPSIIKSFNTVNYEGTDGWDNVTITTDQQSGTVLDFVEKEGKWFNYIRGNDNDLDLRAFNFQGIGQSNDVDYNI